MAGLHTFSVNYYFEISFLLILASSILFFTLPRRALCFVIRFGCERAPQFLGSPPFFFLIPAFPFSPFPLPSLPFLLPSLSHYAVFCRSFPRIPLTFLPFPLGFTFALFACYFSHLLPFPLAVTFVLPLALSSLVLFSIPSRFLLTSLTSVLPSPLRWFCFHLAITRWRCWRPACHSGE